MPKATKFQQRAADRAIRNYKVGGGDPDDMRRSANPRFDPVTVHPGRSSVGGRNLGLSTTPMEKLSNAAQIAKRKKR
jgi:hypothetical protein